MDQLNYTTSEDIRKRGKHLTIEERYVIKTMHKLGFSCRAIAKELNCSPSTISYELKRGTATKSTNIGRPTEYSPKRSQKKYLANRKRCGRKPILSSSNEFLKWVIIMVKKHKWSLDACVGYAKKHNLYADDIVCTKTLYNSLHAGLLGISLFDVPEILARRKHKRISIKNKRNYGKSIDERPNIASNSTEFGHWEIDTVIGKRAGKEAVVLTLVEKLSHHYIAIKIDGKDSHSVRTGMMQLHDIYGSKFHQIFKSITADNGSEFSELSTEDKDGTSIYFAHPYSSWERPQNERHNRIFRRYLPKKHSVENYSCDQILWFADEINSVPRKSLGYKTSDEIFEEYLDKIYAI